VVLFGIGLCVTTSGCAGGTVRDPTSSMVKGEPHRLTAKGSTDGGSPDRHDVVTIAAVGDTMLGNTPELPPDPAGYLGDVKGELRGGFVFGNLEGTLTEVSESPKCPEGTGGDCFAFRTPPEYATYLRDDGFNVMNNANNHSYDFGQAGEEDTLGALNQAGIAQTGLPGQVTVLKSGKRKVAFLGFAPYSNTASLTDLPTAQAMIEGAAGEADIVVVAFHAGAEGTDAQHVTGAEETYLGEDRGNPEAFAHMAIDAGADLILGSGPHVLRGMEFYKERLIAYSLGNFSGFHNFTTEGVLGESVILHVTLSPDGAFRAGRLAPIELAEAGRPVPDPGGAGAELVASLSREDFGASGVTVTSDGRIRAG
jgi:hypothetical protein